MNISEVQSERFINNTKKLYKKKGKKKKELN